MRAAVPTTVVEDHLDDGLSAEMRRGEIVESPKGGRNGEWNSVVSRYGSDFVAALRLDESFLDFVPSQVQPRLQRWPPRVVRIEFRHGPHYMELPAKFPDASSPPPIPGVFTEEQSPGIVERNPRERALAVRDFVEHDEQRQHVITGGTLEQRVVRG